MRANITIYENFPDGSVSKEWADQCRRLGFNPWVRKIPWKRKMESYSSILAWNSPWTDELGGLQPMESQRDITETKHIHNMVNGI